MCDRNNREADGEYLHKLILKSKEELQKRELYTTVGDREALQDMIRLAEEALAGKQQPFVRNREFLNPDDVSQVQFATKRYTMVPTYPMKGYYSFYGLEEALQWFIGRDVRNASDLNRESTLDKCFSFLKETRAGSEPGEYPADVLEKICQKIQKLNDSEKEEESNLFIVEALDALSFAKKSLIYRSDMEENHNPFLDKGELEQLRSLIQKDEHIRFRYLEIKEIADEADLEQRKRAYQESMVMESPFDIWNSQYEFYRNPRGRQGNLFGQTEKNINFRPPEGTDYGIFQFVLDSVDNEKHGLGHVWVDNLVICSGSGVKLEIANSGFENGFENWESGIIGNAEINLESRKPFCGSEQYSAYMKNPDGQSACCLRYREKLPLTDKEIYSLGFDAKIDGKLLHGVTAKILFFDEDGKELDSFSYIYNRKTYLDCMTYNLSMQCDALVYAVTGELSYAQKTKYEILHFMNNFCQGAEYWLYTNERPEGSDAYGAVQGGRNLCSIAFSYAQIKESGVFSGQEKKLFYEYVDYLLRYMMDLRDRSVLTWRQAADYSSNWQTDMCIGMVMILLVLPDFPNRKAWINNACAVLRGQLESKINEDGSWPESIRYHHAALERMASFAQVWRRETGEDLFCKTRLREMFAFSVAMQTPPYVYFGYKIATPPFGDHKLGNGAEYALLGIYMNVVAKSDKELAERMYLTWKRAGFPMKGLSGESLVIEGLMVSPESCHVSGTGLNLTSSCKYPDSGIYIFRNHFGTDYEDFFAVMSSPKPIGHGHLDQGSYILYKSGVPLVMDSGVEGYFDSSTPWHLSSYSHAVVQFEAGNISRGKEGMCDINLSAGTYSRERGWLDVPRTSRVAQCEMGGSIESITIEIENPDGQGRHFRQIICNHEEESYTIRDRIEDFEGRVLMSIPVIAADSVLLGNRILCKGYYGVNLVITLETKYKKAWVEKGRTTPMFPTQEEIPMLDYIRVVADAEDGFVTKLTFETEAGHGYVYN